MSTNIQEIQEDMLTDVVQQLKAVRRKNLLPWWIKVFSWIFLIFGGIAPVLFIMGIAGYTSQLSLYGMETMEPLSITGISIVLLFVLKGIISFGLLRETDWAIKLAMLDAVLGCILCVLVMVLPNVFVGSGAKPGFRLELVVLVLYLNKLLKIKSAWENYSNA